MSLSESFAIVSFALFSLADLRYRLVPGIELFFIGTILLALPGEPFHVAIVLFACIWGLLRNIPGSFSLPFLFYPPALPVLLIGYGHRKGIIGRADLLAIGGLACIFPFSATMLSLVGLEIWRRLWLRRRVGWIPALPGILLGILLHVFQRLLFS